MIGFAKREPAKVNAFDSTRRTGAPFHPQSAGELRCQTIAPFMSAGSERRLHKRQRKATRSYDGFMKVGLTSTALAWVDFDAR